MIHFWTKSFGVCTLPRMLCFTILIIIIIIIIIIDTYIAQCPLIAQSTVQYGKNYKKYRVKTTCIIRYNNKNNELKLLKSNIVSQFK